MLFNSQSAKLYRLFKLFKSFASRPGIADDSESVHLGLWPVVGFAELAALGKRMQLPQRKALQPPTTPEQAEAA